MKGAINVDILDHLIIGRVEPHIYAFTTETIPNYLKVGDTYRPIAVRLNEWRKSFPNLEKIFQDVAKVDDETFFRDHAVHYFLEKQRDRKRLQKTNHDDFPYYSNEFFQFATDQDIRDALIDIRDGYRANDPKYQYYKFSKSHVPIIHTYERTQSFLPRPNQQETILRFESAIAKGRTNLLMYAVMRFGKSFTSMCCASSMSARIVVVVSAKADVKEEWKKTVESHVRFKSYSFLDSHALLRDETAITQKLASSESVVLFLTLQDLQGNEIKSKHREIFENQIDLLLIDETHFGVRAGAYGQVLKEDNLTAKEIKNELKLQDESLDVLKSNSKFLKAKVRLHLSGTPYRILMNSEFTNDDIIAFYQFSDIADDQKAWDAKHLNEDDVKEWDNPYYGFPQMIRFAFNPNESSRKKMEEMKQRGITYAFSELFKPCSITFDRHDHLHRKFIHEEEILNLLKVIDGSEEDVNLLSFLDYDKIQEGKMCRHMVCVLPYRASCDALEELIKKHAFKHLGLYQIINISGVEYESKYIDNQSVQTEIKKLEAQNVKTITLTVNRMLTGSTVPEWDTMLYFKDTASPQEYDQAIFRLQNQYIKVYSDAAGDVIKYNLKPQTLLVDFNPNRMFEMQEHKAQIYNANTDKSGNNQLEQRITRELEISPIVVLNHCKIAEVKAADIIDAVRKYASNRSVLDEATSISIDYTLLDIPEVKAEIDRQGKIGSRQGLEILPFEGKGDELDVESKDESTSDKGEPGQDKLPTEKDPELDYRSKFATFYARILFFAFLTESVVKSLADIISETTSNDDNQRIATNIAINQNILILIQRHTNPFILSELDYKIQNINSLANDTAITPILRAGNAMKKFSRLSDAEVVTPEIMTDMIVRSIPADAHQKPFAALDIASKQGEFVYAYYKRFGREAARNFYSIPTSKLAYELTRKVYALLELDINYIERDRTSYDIFADSELRHLTINNIEPMQFNAIVGNPPYQQKEGGANNNTALPIYQHFVELAKRLDPDYISLIMPTRWFAGGRGLDGFRDEMLNDVHISELHDFLRPELIFQNINNRGGICYFLWEKSFDNREIMTKVFSYQDDLNPVIIQRNLRTPNSDILIRHGVGVSIIEKVNQSPDFESLSPYISAAKAFGFRTYFIKDKKFRSSPKQLKDPVLCYGRAGTAGYVERAEVLSHQDWIDVWKVFIPESNNIGTELNDDNQNAFIGKPGSVCTETFLVVGADLLLDGLSSRYLSNYLRTKFARFMHSLAKVSQHGTSRTYQFVPLQNFTPDSDIDWIASSEKIDQQLYQKYQLTSEEISFIERMIKSMSS